MAKIRQKKSESRTVDIDGSASLLSGGTTLPDSDDAVKYRKFRKIIFSVSIFALILRVVATFEMSLAGDGINNMFAPLSTSDLATYMQLGREIAAGKFPEVFYYQPFYYAVFLPLIYLIAGKYAIWAVIGVQTVLSAATVYLAGLCGEKIFGRRAGIIAAVCCAISSPLILYVPFHQNETLHCYWLTLLTFLSLRAVEKRRWRDWCFAGIVAGAAITTRGNINLLLPAIIGCMMLAARRNGENGKHIGGKTVVFLACAVLLQLPFIIHNSVALKRFSGPSTAADAVLALGNTVEAPAGGRDPGLPAGAMYYPEAWRRAMARAQEGNGVSMGKQMWEFFCDEPAAFLELQFRKALLFWDGREIPNNVSLEYDGYFSRVLRYLLPGRSVVLLTLSLAGLLWFIPLAWRKRDCKLLLLYGVVLSFYVAVVLFYILSRFRAPVLPLLFIFAGGWVDEVWKKAKTVPREKRSPFFSRVILVQLAAFGVVFSFYDNYRFYLEPGINRLIRPDGIMLSNGGQDVQFFDHGPAPWGGWREITLKPGMKFYKKFAHCGTEYGKLYFSFASLEGGTLKLLLNGHPFELPLPPPSAGKSVRKWTYLPVMLNNGEVEVEIVETTAPVNFILDVQRDYGRSGLDGEIQPGEWVFRFGR